MACAYGKDGDGCAVGNNTLTAGGGHGGFSRTFQQVKGDELTYKGKLIFLYRP